MNQLGDMGEAIAAAISRKTDDRIAWVPVGTDHEGVVEWRPTKRKAWAPGKCSGGMREEFLRVARDEPPPMDKNNIVRWDNYAVILNALNSEKAMPKVMRIMRKEGKP